MKQTDRIERIRQRLRTLAEQVAQDEGIELLNVRFKRDEDDGHLTDIQVSYQETERTESENGNPQPEGERK